MKIKKHIRRNDIIVALGLFCISAFWIWRIRLGISEYDEAFYLTIPYRMSLGDTLLIDEWHVSQLSGFVLWPLMALYRGVVHGTEGIILSFRYIWLFFHQMVSLTAYLLLRHRNKKGGLYSCLLYSMFVPFGIMALSYNSIGLGAAFLLAILWSESYCSVIANVCKGILLSVLVLCNPYCVIIYLFLWMQFLWKKIKRTPEEFPFSHMIYLHIGIASVLIPFLIHVGKGVQSISQLLQCMIHIVNDPEHPPKSLVSNLLDQIQLFVARYPIFIACFVCITVISLLFRKKKEENICALALFLLCCITSLYDAIYHYMEYGMNTCAMFLAFWGWEIPLFLKNYDKRKYIWRCVFPIVYSVCMTTSSNQGIYVIADALFIGSCLVPITIEEYFDTEKAYNPNKMFHFEASIAVTFGILIQLISLTYVRLYSGGQSRSIYRYALSKQFV